VFVDQYVIDKLTQLQIDNDVCIELPELFENTGIEAQRKIDFIVTLGGDGTILWASK
jgi:NAD kinase